MIEIPVSVGELFDKVSILVIKLDKFIPDTEQYKNVNREYVILKKISSELLNNSEYVSDDIRPFIFIDDILHELQEVNRNLWDVEDKLRRIEKTHIFDNQFIRLARSVYVLNDQRARLKKKLNHIFGSVIVEEKKYESYE